MKKIHLIQFFLLFASAFFNSTEAQCPSTKGTTTNFSTAYNVRNNVTFSGDVVITNGVTLVLTGTIRMKKDASIKVMKGGRLDVKNATLTSACPNELWGGIEAHNINNSSLLYYQIYVENSTIENAKVGIINSDKSNYLSKIGGSLYCTNSTFKNNWIDIYLIEQGGVLPVIKNCNFLSTKYYNTTFNNPSLSFPNNEPKHIFISNIGDSRVTKITGCVFSSSVPVSLIPSQSSKVGIVANDVILSIEKCEFTNLMQGIVASKISSNRVVSVSNSNFYDVLGDNITFSGINNGIVSNNIFYVTAYNVLGNSVIILNNSPNTAVYNNIMEGNMYRGIIANDIGGVNTLISMNQIAIKGLPLSAYGINGKYNVLLGRHEGVAFLCNKIFGNNNNNSTNIGIGPGNAGGLGNGGIRGIQATYNTSNGQTIASAGNTFTSKLFNSSNTFHIDNTAKSFGYYYDGSPISSNVKFPNKVKSVTRVQYSTPAQCTIPKIVYPRSAEVSKLTNEEKVLIKNSRDELSRLINKTRVEFNQILLPTTDQVENFEATLTVVKSEKDVYTTNLIYDLLLGRDSLVPLDTSELFDLYRSYENPHGYYQIADYLFSIKNYDVSSATLRIIPLIFQLSEEELKNHNQLMEFYTLLKNLYTSNRTIFEINDEEKNLLRIMADKPAGDAKYRACNWLNLIMPGSCIINNPPINIDTMIDSTLNINVETYPIPANDILNFKFNLPSYLDVINLKIFDINGVEKISKEILRTSPETTINTSMWNRGLYFYHVVYNGRILYSKTIMIDHN